LVIGLVVFICHYTQTRPGFQQSNTFLEWAEARFAGWVSVLEQRLFDEGRLPEGIPEERAWFRLGLAAAKATYKSIPAPFRGWELENPLQAELLSRTGVSEFTLWSADPHDYTYVGPRAKYPEHLVGWYALEANLWQGKLWNGAGDLLKEISVAEYSLGGTKDQQPFSECPEPQFTAEAPEEPGFPAQEAVQETDASGDAFTPSEPTVPMSTSEVVPSLPPLPPVAGPATDASPLPEGGCQEGNDAPAPRERPTTVGDAGWHTMRDTPPDDFHEEPLVGEKVQITRALRQAEILSKQSTVKVLDIRVQDPNSAFWGQKGGGRHYRLYVRQSAYREEQVQRALSELEMIKAAPYRSSDHRVPTRLYKAHKDRPLRAKSEDHIARALHAAAILDNCSVAALHAEIRKGGSLFGKRTDDDEIEVYLSEKHSAKVEAALTALESLKGLPGSTADAASAPSSSNGHT
jgi:hypothetical protein